MLNSETNNIKGDNFSMTSGELSDEAFIAEPNKNTELDKAEDEDRIAFESLEEHIEILDYVFDDSSVKPDTSPFMTYPDDKQEFIGKTSYVDLGKTIQQYRNGEINERMLSILEIIIQHKYISTRQIWQMYLLKYGIYIKRNNLKKLLNHMSEKHLLVEFVIQSSIGETKYHIYCADYNGVRLYTALTSGITDWKKTDTLQKPYIVKSSLAKNQFLISYLKHYDIEYKLYPKLNWIDEKKHELSIVPTMQLTFKVKEKLDRIVFLVEVIRTYKGWDEKYSEKLIRYGKYMKSVEDTQDLKKYYIIVCAESQEQIGKAAELLYKLRHVNYISELRNINIFYTHDLELLDSNIKKTLLDNLRSYEFNYEKKLWEECHLDFEIEQRDWHNLEFKVEKIQQESCVAKVDIKNETPNYNHDLPVEIYKIVKSNGLKFPQSITRLAPLLKSNGIDYKEMGYKKLKELFEGISEYYSIYFDIPTEMMVNCSRKLNDLIDNLGLEDQNCEEHAYNLQGNNNDTNEKNIIEKYFFNGIKSNNEHKKIFIGDIYCFKNWDVTVALIIKMTHINDLSREGWLNILSYSYYLANKEERVLINTSNTYMAFDTQLLTFDGKKIYLLAKNNYRQKPNWLLEGLTTANSKVLGEILRNEFMSLFN